MRIEESSKNKTEVLCASWKMHQPTSDTIELQLKWVSEIWKQYLNDVESAQPKSRLGHAPPSFFTTDLK